MRLSMFSVSPDSIKERKKMKTNKSPTPITTPRMMLPVALLKHFSQTNPKLAE